MRSITIGDLCELTDYSRDQMRGLLAELPRFASRHAAPRIARVYSNHDVMLLAVLSRLESVYGLKRSVVATLCEPIAAVLKTPREASKHARLVLRVAVGACEYVEEVPTIGDGLVVELAPIFLAIDSYLLPTPLMQREIGLTSVFVVEKATGKSRRAREQGRALSATESRGRQKERPSHG